MHELIINYICICMAILIGELYMYVPITLLHIYVPIQPYTLSIGANDNHASLLSLQILFCS